MSSVRHKHWEEDAALADLSHSGGVCYPCVPQLTLGLLWAEVLESLTQLMPGQSALSGLPPIPTVKTDSRLLMPSSVLPLCAHMHIT